MSFVIVDSCILPASMEYVWNGISYWDSDFFSCLSLLFSFEGFNIHGKKKEEGDRFRIGDRARMVKPIACCGIVNELDWAITAIEENTKCDHKEGEYEDRSKRGDSSTIGAANQGKPNTCSMTTSDYTYGVMSTMTFKVEKIPDDEESCVFTCWLSCSPLHWKYLFTMLIHRKVCRIFFAHDFEDLHNYYTKRKEYKAREALPTSSSSENLQGEEGPSVRLNLPPLTSLPSENSQDIDEPTVRCQKIVAKVPPPSDLIENSRNGKKKHPLSFSSWKKKSNTSSSSDSKFQSLSPPKIDEPTLQSICSFSMQSNNLKRKKMRSEKTEGNTNSTFFVW